MKNLKSFLAIVMVLVIGACLTGCQSAEEKAESERLVLESVAESESVSESIVLVETHKAANTEFATWFSNVNVKKGESGAGIILSLVPTDYTETHLVSAMAPAVLVIDGVENEYSRFSMKSDAILSNVNGYNEIVGYEFSSLDIHFDDVNVMYYDSITVTITDDNDQEITLTYYPNV
jgi:hypothetical protein